MNHMDMYSINDRPYHRGGRFGPSQEVYYAQQRLRLWIWYCITTGTRISMNETHKVYRQKKEILQHLCDTLQLSTEGTKDDLIARLDRYNFTAEQIIAIESPKR